MKHLFTLLLSLLIAPAAMAWGSLGHSVIVEIAKEYLTDRTREEIARYMPYDITEDASWMDDHRKDPGIDYTTHWHSFAYTADHKYDVNRYLRRGDVLRALEIADHNLTRYRELTDSAVVMNLRFVLHFVGDMHCPTHANPPFKAPRHQVTLKGKPYKKFHTVYDAMPKLIHKTNDAAEIAERIDNQTAKQRTRIVEGSFLDWADEIAGQCYVIYEWCPVETVEIDPSIIERSADLVNMELRNAGYRTAALLNRYFDPQP